MEANELMIGYWVCIETLPMKVLRLCEHYIDVLTVKGNEIHTVYAEIKPIPLTEDILKANGFQSNDNNELEIKFPTTFMFRSYVTAYHIEGKNDFIIDVHKVCNDYSSNTVHMVIKCVHELQHALRLCGLNELADNFKIN